MYCQFIHFSFLISALTIRYTWQENNDMVYRDMYKILWCQYLQCTCTISDFLQRYKFAVMFNFSAFFEFFSFTKKIIFVPIFWCHGIYLCIHKFYINLLCFIYATARPFLFWNILWFISVRFFLGKLKTISGHRKFVAHLCT